MSENGDKLNMLSKTAGKKARVKVYEGTILTVDARDSVARYLVEDQGRIVYVGDDLPERFADASREQLGDRVLCPAFVDTHEHLASFATFNAG